MERVCLKMYQDIDSKIRLKLLAQDITLPDECQKRINKTIKGLPDYEIKKVHLRFRPIIVIVAVCLVMSSITVFAAIDYIRQRMESLSEEEKESYYEGVQNSQADADSYSREFTDSEKERIEELRAKYNNGLYPAQKLPVVKTKADADSKAELYFVEDTSLFVLPARELTEEEILKVIDFYYSRDFSLMEKVKENKVTVSPKEFVEKGGMTEQEIIELAKGDIKKVYGIDCVGFEVSVEYLEFTESTYYVDFKDKNTKSSYGITFDADKKIAEELHHTQSIDQAEIKVDQEKLKAKYEIALDMLKKWRGNDLKIVRSTCEYNYNSNDCMEHGMASYMFEMEDGTGYVMYYSCASDVFFNIFMTDYDEYRQRVNQNNEIRKEKGIIRKIIEMQ